MKVKYIEDEYKQNNIFLHNQNQHKGRINRYLETQKQKTKKIQNFQDCKISQKKIEQLETKTNELNH